MSRIHVCRNGLRAERVRLAFGCRESSSDSLLSHVQRTEMRKGCRQITPSGIEVREFGKRAQSKNRPDRASNASARDDPQGITNRSGGARRAGTARECGPKHDGGPASRAAVVALGAQICRNESSRQSYATAGWLVAGL